MENEVKNKKVVLSDDELQQVAGGGSNASKQSCSIITTKDLCLMKEKEGCVWNNGRCELVIRSNRTPFDINTA